MSGGSGDALPLWPARSFASSSVAELWPTGQVQAVSLQELVNSLLPSLAMEAIGVAVLLGPDGASSVLTAGELRGLLTEYLEEHFSDHF